MELFNGDLDNLVTPINMQLWRELMEKTNNDYRESEYLLQGFETGFSLEYEDPLNRKDMSHNIPFRDGVGSPSEMWEKMIKEVRAGRFAGPFDEIPFEHYVQSPIGLVPKANGETRLIFHLSYDFKNHRSVNASIPKEKCTVKYRDLDHALKSILKLLKDYPNACIVFGICDLKSAFCLVPLKR